MLTFLNQKKLTCIKKAYGEKLLIEHLELIGNLSDELKICISNCVRKASYKKNETIYRQGDQLQKMYFIHKGLVVGEHYIEDRSHVCWFLKEQDFIADLGSFVNHRPAKCTA